MPNIEKNQWDIFASLQTIFYMDTKLIWVIFNHCVLHNKTQFAGPSICCLLQDLLQHNLMLFLAHLI